MIRLCTSWPLVREKVKGHDDAMNDGSSLQVCRSLRTPLQGSPTRGAELMLPPAPAKSRDRNLHRAGISKVCVTPM
ncbi:unnamed protein product [Jaminaea pallidilutea]